MLSHRARTPSSQGLVCEARAVRVWMQRGADRLLTQPHHPRQAKSAILYPSDLGVLHKGDLTLQKQWVEKKSRLTSEEGQRPNTRASKKKPHFQSQLSNQNCTAKLSFSTPDVTCSVLVPVPTLWNRSLGETDAICYCCSGSPSYPAALHHTKSFQGYQYTKFKDNFPEHAWSVSAEASSKS